MRQRSEYSIKSLTKIQEAMHVWNIKFPTKVIKEESWTWNLTIRKKLHRKKILEKLKDSRGK